MTWRLVTEFFASLGYGFLGSFVPVFNAAAYLVATQALGITAEVTAAFGIAAGEAAGKVTVFVAVRQGTKLPFLQRQLDRDRARMAARKSRATHPGRFRSTYQKWSARLLDLIGHSRWGPVITFMSGLIGVPPLLAVQFIVPATKMPAWVFAVTVFLGRSLLYLAIAFGAGAIFTRLWN